MAIVPSETGFVLVDSTLNPIASNAEAVQILAFPNKPERIKQLPLFLADRIRTALVDHHAQGATQFVKEYKSGKRRYVCRCFHIEQSVRNGANATVALLLERSSSGNTLVQEVSSQFDLTQREKETVELLLQGLTSKEIAKRMSISPNTVKAFLRLVMVKMGVSTRSGIVGRIVGPRSGA